MQTQTSENVQVSEAPTFEKVWAMMQETDRRIQEIWEKQEKRQAEDRKETGCVIKELSRQMGDLHRSFGEIAEHLVAPGIAERFNEMGYHFGVVTPGGCRILDEKGKIKTEIDIMLENGDCIIAVEVKTKPRVQDIEHHVKRLEILREYRNKLNDKRKIKGAIAGAVFYSAEKEAAIAAGFYVLEQSGDTMKLEIPDDFVAKEW